MMEEIQEIQEMLLICPNKPVNEAECVSSNAEFLSYTYIQVYSICIFNLPFLFICVGHIYS
jgi:hypothetical protein